MIESNIKDYKYSLSELAKLDEKQDLGLKLLKPRNPNALRGREFDILLVNKTTLIVRREWVKKSQLLVIIPEKLIYKIFNEQTGECLYDPDLEFMDRMPKNIGENGLFDYNEEIHRDSSWWNRPERLNDYQKQFIGQQPNKTSISKFFKNLNNSDISERIETSEFMWGNEMFHVKYGTYSTDYKDKWYYNELPYDISTLENRQKICLYMKSPYTLTKGAWKLDMKLPLDKIKLVLKLLVEFPNNYEHIMAYAQLRVEHYPNRQPITDINIIRRILRGVEPIPGYWSDSTTELRASMYRYYYGINEWTKYKNYLQEVECVTIDQMHYFDILEQAKALNNGKIKEKYPANWLTWEQKVKTLYNKHKKFLESQKAFTYSELVESLEHNTATDNLDHDFIIVLPRTYGEILEEGEKMKHCVGGYADGIFNGERLVLFLRKKNKPDKPYGTIDFTWSDKDDLKTYKLNQIKGQGNTNLPIEAIAYIKRYMEIKKIEEVKEYYVKQAIENGTVDKWIVEEQERKELEKKAKEEAQKSKKINTFN